MPNLPANRVAALGGTAASAVGVALALLDQFENETMKAVVLITALVCITAIAVVFMLGSHKYDALIFGEGSEPQPDLDPADTDATFPDPDEAAVDTAPLPHDFEVSPDIDRS